MLQPILHTWSTRGAEFHGVTQRVGVFPCGSIVPTVSHCLMTSCCQQVAAPGPLVAAIDFSRELVSANQREALIPDAVTQAEVQAWSAPIRSAFSEVVGRTHVFLDGTRTSCRLSECNLGESREKRRPTSCPRMPCYCCKTLRPHVFSDFWLCGSVF